MNQEDFELLLEARQEYLDRMQELQELDGPEFEDAADDLQKWAEEVNEDLNDFVQDTFGEALAIDTESLVMLRQSRDPGA